MTDQILNEVVTRSNTYAKKVKNSSQPLRRKSVLNTWKDITVTEMKQFLGLVLHMGLVAMPTCHASLIGLSIDCIKPDFSSQ